MPGELSEREKAVHTHEDDVDEAKELIAEARRQLTRPGLKVRGEPTK